MTIQTRNGEREALAFFLAAQRTSVLAIVDELSDDQMSRPLVPSGWTLAGLIEHLGDAERVWFQHVIAGEETFSEPERPGDEPAGNGFKARQGVTEALAHYRAETGRSDEILNATSLDAPPAARPPVSIGIADEVVTVRDIILHMIEETARHAGHLDITRELLDGRTGLGGR